MAIVVTHNGSRLDAMEDDTNVTDIGGGVGAGQEPDFVYQGDYSVSRKVGTSPLGFYTDIGGTPVDISESTGDYQTVMFKILATNKDVLELVSVPGLEIRIGSDSSNYYTYNVEGNDTYPIKGGWLIRPIDPNVSSYRAGATGSPDLTAAGYFGIVGDFTAASKSENVAMDAVDVGDGLTLNGTPGGTFQDFIDEDEGTDANRWGYISTLEDIIFICGTLTIGDGTQTEFDDNRVTVVFPDGRFKAGWTGLRIGLQHSSSDIDIADSNFFGKGTVSGIDTRPIFTVISGYGSLLVDNCLFDNFASFVLTSGAAFHNTSLINSELLTQAGSLIDGCTIDSPPVTSGIAFLLCDAPDNIKNSTFISAGDGHAIEITVSGEYDFDANFFQGYGGDTTLSAAIYNNCGGALVLNVLNGGDTPTYRNGSGASTTINNAVTIKVTVIDEATDPIEEAQVAVYKISDDTELMNEDTTALGVAEQSFSYTSDTDVYIRVRKSSTGATKYVPFSTTGTITSAGLTITVTLYEDTTAT